MNGYIVIGITLACILFPFIVAYYKGYWQRAAILSVLFGVWMIIFIVLRLIKK